MTRKPCVYKNIAITMFAMDVSIGHLAKMTHIGYKALCRKLNGESMLSIDDAIAIHQALGKPMPVDILFSRE